MSRTALAEGAEGIRPGIQSRTICVLTGVRFSQDLHAFSATPIETPQFTLAIRLLWLEGVESNHKINDLTEIIIGCAIALHEQLGPGLLHSVYLTLLAQRLLERNLSVEVEKPVPLVDGTVEFTKAFRADLVVNDEVIVEVKAIKKVTDVDLAQLLTYLRLLDKRVGLIINFNVSVLRHGIRRVVNRYVNDEGQLL